MYAALNSTSAILLSIRTRVILIVAIAASLWSTGCKTLSLPAIDPSGNRIFNGQWTPVVGPHDPNNGYPSTAPAYQTPPEPPPCMQGSDGKKGKLCQGCLSGKGCLARKKEAEEVRGRCGQLLLTPTRIVAPVGGEVILLAGICGKDEILVTNEPIEWMLAPNSVGEFVAVGDDAKGETKSFWKRDDRPKVEKLGIDFARGRTSSQAGVITRGTSNTADDLPVRKGQTWISLTSPTEGTSKVTAFAPDSDVWDQRRQTATIYWIDASWQLPGPVNARSGEEVQLITRVMRSEGFAPAEGWIVRYRSLNPDFARFVPGNLDQVSVNVDANGVALARIVNGSANASATPFGSALVEVEIVKPTRGSENMPELQIARGTTMVTWSAASLVLDAVGPEVAVPGQDLPYTISIANVGDVVSESTILNVTIPSGMQVRSTSYQPDSQPTNNTVRWTIGPLQPRMRFDVTMNLVATAELDGRIQVDVSGAPNLRQQKILRTLVQKPTISLQFTPRQGLNQVEVGSEAAFEVVLMNTGNQTVNNLTIVLASDPGLVHIRGGNESIQTLDYLTPGQRRPLDAIFVAQREGPLCATATVQSAGQILATQKACIQAIPATPKRPSMRLQIENVSRNSAIAVGEQFEMNWSLVNNGQTILRGPIVTMQVDSALEVGGISRDFEKLAERGFYRWRLTDMPPGVRVQLSAAMRGITEIQRANVSLRVETADGLSETQTLSIGIGPNGVPPAISSGSPSGVNSGNPIRSGFGAIRSAEGADLDFGRQISVSIVSVNNNVKRGEIGTYEIRVENFGNKPQQQVSLNVLLPEKATLSAIRAKELRYRLANNDHKIDFEPIKYLRGNEVFSFTIQLRIDGIDESEIVASASSSSQTDPSLHRLTIRPAP